MEGDSGYYQRVPLPFLFISVRNPDDGKGHRSNFFFCCSLSLRPVFLEQPLLPESLAKWAFWSAGGSGMVALFATTLHGFVSGEFPLGCGNLAM